jgi:hypothetical protein
LILNFNRDDITRYTNGITHGFVIVRHLHDEATMRLRSQLPADPPASHGSAAAPAAEHGLPRIPDSRRVPLRGRSSKIQNNVVTMHRNSTDKPLSVLLELQPLARKTAETMATALRQVIETVANQMAASTQGRVVRLIHCLVGMASTQITQRHACCGHGQRPLQWLHTTASWCSRARRTLRTW